MKNNYTIKYLSSFDKEFNEILYYITYILQNKIAAENLLKSVDIAINKRSINPKNFEIYKSNKKRKYNFYKINIKSFTIFYTVRNNTMEIVHILYKKRNFNNLI